MKRKKTVFLTGATGLLGSYLLKILLQNGHKVYVLARRQKDKSAKQRVIDVLKFWDHEVLKNNDKLIVLEGDITKKDLGFNEKTKKILQDEIEEVLHCAANTGFNQPLKEIKNVNVRGVKNILEISHKLMKKGKLKKVNHISTAYICGDYKNVFTENNLDVKQKFNSSYEQSKFEAEKIVKDYRKKRIWIDVFRPAAIVGESKTGKIFRFEHIYQLLRFWSLESVDIYPIEGSLSVDLVCIDDAAKAIYAIFCNTKLKNKTYHIFGASPLSTKEIFDLARNSIGFKKPKMVSWDEFDAGSLSFAQRNLVRKMTLFSDALARAKLDSRLTRAILGEYNFTMPSFNQQDFKKIIRCAIKSKFLAKNDKNILKR
jgi:long-chain acyl-CoA synthetase